MAVPANSVRGSGSMKAAARILCARPDNEQELMKILTVLAAALAAGLTTFAANALEEGSQQASDDLATKPDATCIADRVKDD